MAKKPIQSTTYKDVKPTEVDVSQVVDRPGIYQVRFQYTSGRFGLQIRKVELETKNR